MLEGNPRNDPVTGGRWIREIGGEMQEGERGMDLEVRLRLVQFNAPQELCRDGLPVGGSGVHATQPEQLQERVLLAGSKYGCR